VTFEYISKPVSFDAMPSYRSRPRSSRSRRARPFKRTRGTNRSRSGAAFAKRVKAVVLRTAEPKFLRTVYALVQMYHNLYIDWHLNVSTKMPAQGAGDSQRIGDQIYTTSYRLDMLIGQKQDRPNVSFRWFVVQLPKGASVATTSWIDVVTGDLLIDRPNTDICKIIKSGVWKEVNAVFDAAAPKEYTFAKTLTFQHKRKYKFGPGDAVLTHNQDDLHFFMVAYDAYGTLITDNVAYCQLLQTIYYRDP